jgi:phage terminase large subunit-like protein
LKVHVELDLTPEEARRFLGLPDVAPMQARMLEEMERRMRAAVDTSDPESMLRAWLPMGGQGLEQFQRFLWDSAKAAAGGASGGKGTSNPSR